MNTLGMISSRLDLHIFWALENVMMTIQSSVKVSSSMFWFNSYTSLVDRGSLSSYVMLLTSTFQATMPSSMPIFFLALSTLGSASGYNSLISLYLLFIFPLPSLLCQSLQTFSTLYNPNNKVLLVLKLSYLRFNLRLEGSLILLS